MTRPIRTVAAWLLLGATLFTACSDGSGPTAEPTTTETPATTAPSGPPPGAVEAGLRELEVGSCFETVADPAASDRAVWSVDCETPHTHEVYDLAVIDVGGGEYPGEDVVRNAAEDACFAGFEEFVGIRWTLSTLDIATWWPTAESWAIGDRTAICTVVPDTGDEVTGTQQGSGS